MIIEYLNPLSRAWDTMKHRLFKPFDLNKWFLIGFTAFLAELLDGGGNGGSGGKFNKLTKEDFDLGEKISSVIYWIQTHPGWVAFIVIGIILVICLLIILTWLSSRGKFMFLDNVVHDRAEVAKPWHEFKVLGNSLFLWRLGFGLISLLIVLSILAFGLTIFYNAYQSGSFHRPDIVNLASIALVLIFLFIVIGYISLAVNDFIVPIMYSKNLMVLQAWDYFMPILKNYLINFIGYGLFIFFITILIVIAVVIIGFMTCCIGFILLIIPYLGSVITLPISYTYRVFSVNFLEQFGDDFKIFPVTTSVLS
jgi:hypothetical protein